MRDKDKIDAENLFINLGYFKIWNENGFFYYNPKDDKVIEFNLKQKVWAVYDYETSELRGYGNELLKAILLQEFELNWLTWKEYQEELSYI